MHIAVIRAGKGENPHRRDKAYMSFGQPDHVDRGPLILLARCHVNSGTPGCVARQASLNSNASAKFHKDGGKLYGIGESGLHPKRSRRGSSNVLKSSAINTGKFGSITGYRASKNAVPSSFILGPYRQTTWKFRSSRLNFATIKRPALSLILLTT